MGDPAQSLPESVFVRFGKRLALRPASTNNRDHYRGDKRHLALRR